jgi:hypothetical protein
MNGGRPRSSFKNGYQIIHCKFNNKCALLRILNLMRTWFLIILFLVFTSTLALSNSEIWVSGQRADERIFPIDSLPYGESYPQWVSNWWQWHISIPAELHPRENYKPERCSLMQEGPVWFLADGPNRSPVERDCAVPLGKAILVQISGGECDYGEPELDTDIKVKDCVDSGNIGAIVQAWIDGKEIVGIQNMRSGYNWFNITVPENNIYEEKPGVYKALSDGWFLFIKPLPSGIHDIRIKGDVTRIGPDGVPTDEDHHIDVTYHLQIK